MGDPAFGTDTRAFDKEALRLAQQLDDVYRREGERPNAVERDIMQRRLYESCFGIHNHYSGERKPFSLVAARQKEETYLYSKKLLDYDRYFELRVKEHTGLNIAEFFAQPFPDIEFMFAKCDKLNKREELSAEDLKRKYEAALANEEEKKKQEKNKG